MFCFKKLPVQTAPTPSRRGRGCLREGDGAAREEVKITQYKHKEHFKD